MILLYVLLALLALVLLALATPVYLNLRAEFGETCGFALDVRPFGGFCPPLRLTAKDPSSDAPQRQTPRKDPKPRKRGKRRSPVAKRLIRAIPGLIRSEFSRIHIDRLHLDLSFGTGDPADTGRIYGQCMPLVHAWPRLDIDLRPDFTQACFRGAFDGAVHLTPLSLAWPLLKALAGAKP